jgi:L-ascorbate metabolism protein UlaG (beta-lactamase superfamily)
MTLSGVKFTAREVRHWGARTFLDSYRGFSAFLIESDKHRILYGGDTAYHERFKDIGKVDLAIFGIGAYDPYIQAHATPEQAWAMAQHVDADQLLPMHHSTFRLSHEPMEEPMKRLLAAAGKEADRVAVREVGGQWGRDD